MTINSTAAILLLLYQLVAEEQGVDSGQLRGTIQNDILKEYVARGTYIYPPRPSMRLVTDVFAYSAAELPQWNPISISGYHIREAGSTAAQELAFTIANGLAYVRAAIDAGLDVDLFAPRLSFFWNGHNEFFEEIAKYRAGRRIWARLMRDEIGAKDPKSWAMRFHTQTAGFHAHRSAAVEQCGSHHDASPRRGPRRNPVASHQLLRRGARSPPPMSRLFSLSAPSR